jgi:hypothetical protein
MYEEEKNVVFTCKKHGKEQYFKIKKFEVDYHNLVYVWFDLGGVVEKMWVKIAKGNQKKGRGLLYNKPALLKHLKVFDFVRYKTDEEGITRAIIKTN